MLHRLSHPGAPQPTFHETAKPVPRVAAACRVPTGSDASAPRGPRFWCESSGVWSFSQARLSHFGVWFRGVGCVCDGPRALSPGPQHAGALAGGAEAALSPCAQLGRGQPLGQTGTAGTCGRRPELPGGPHGQGASGEASARGGVSGALVSAGPIWALSTERKVLMLRLPRSKTR